MPYLLPADPDVSELDCVLVYFPNAPEYRQALFGQLAELSDVWNWEGTREAQAAARAAWLSAELETLNNMGCFDEVLAELQSINAKLPWCCDVELPDILIDPVGGGDIFIYPTPGPPPLPIPDNDTGETAEDYPITPVTDPNGDGIVARQDWLDYVCGAADWLVDSWIDWLRFTRFLIVMGNTTVRAISWLVSRIAANILPGVLDDFAVWEMPSLTEIISTHMQDLTTGQIDTAISQLENARDALKCGLVGGSTAEQAIGAVLGVLSGEITNASIYAILASPVAAIASMIWNGAVDVAWDDGCDCADWFFEEYNFGSAEEGWAGWTNVGATLYDTTYGCGGGTAERAEITIGSLPSAEYTFTLRVLASNFGYGGSNTIRLAIGPSEYTSAAVTATPTWYEHQVTVTTTSRTFSAGCVAGSDGLFIDRAEIIINPTT